MDRLEVEIERFRARWRSGDRSAVADFERRFHAPLRRIARRFFRTRRLDGASAARCQYSREKRVAAAVHQMAEAVLSSETPQLLARETARNDKRATRLFSFRAV